MRTESILGPLGCRRLGEMCPELAEPEQGWEKLPRFSGLKGHSFRVGLGRSVADMSTAFARDEAEVRAAWVQFTATNPADQAKADQLGAVVDAELKLRRMDRLRRSIDDGMVEIPGALLRVAPAWADAMGYDPKEKP